MVFGVLLVMGTVIATLGSITFPVGDKISDFWPGIVIQTLGGLWFGKIGTLAGVIFPIFSNIFIGGNQGRSARSTPDAVLLDDDPLVRLNWGMTAQSKSIRLAAFANPKVFLEAVEDFAKDTSIYLDKEPPWA
jgi:hypothetical protein